MDVGNDCVLSVDGVDMDMPEHGRRWYSHKIKRSGLRYEVGLSIRSGDICWVNGPYECGKWPDISIFRDSLLSHLGESERVEADDGYIGEHSRYIKCPAGFTNPEETLFMQQRVRNRQETVNKRLKQFSILKQRFRHDMPKHGDVFRACAVLVQLSINDGDKLFHCGYRDINNRKGKKRNHKDDDKDNDEDSEGSLSMEG